MKIKINGTYIKFFDQVSIALTLDSVASAFSFVGRYNPENPLHRDIFRPLSFPRVEIYTNDDKLRLTGTIVKHEKTSQRDPQLWALSGYSLGGALEDVNIPRNLYPLESINRNLRDITQRLIAPFGISLQVDATAANAAGINYDKSVATPSESIKSYIAKLASQRNIVLSHTAKGDLLFFKPTVTAPVYRFNKQNTLSMRISVNGQGLHSTITVLRQPEDGDSNLTPADSVTNPLVGVNRPSVKVMTSGTETATQDAANNELAAELKNIALTVEFDRYIEVLPGDIVEVQNDEVFLFSYQKFMVAGANHTETVTATTTTLDLVLPETYTGNQPKNIFE